MRLIVLAVLGAVLIGCNGGGNNGTTPTPPPPAATNSAPTATSASISTNKNTASTPVTPSVSDPDSGDIHSFSIVSQPANGVATVVGAQLVYTPNTNFSGNDSFTFRATDAGSLFVVGTATVTVITNAPTATSASISTNKNTASTPVTPLVSDPDSGETHSFSIVSQPARGSASVIGNTLVYTPDIHVTGPDSFTFRATDTDGLFVVGTATVTIAPTNSTPVATQAGITARSGLAGSPVTPYVNDADFPETFTFQVLSSPASGTASVVNNRLVYTPNGGFTSGLDNFTYRATDSNSNTIDGTARVRVYDNTPPGSDSGLGRCTTASTVNNVTVNGQPQTTLNVRINAGSCAFYGEAVTRVTSTGTDVTVKYVVHRPSNGALPKAVVVLIAGGSLAVNLVGDITTGNITSTTGNFVVRSAQLVAEAGYLAVVVDRPSNFTDSDTEATIDAYRISVDHAVDILAVTGLVNTDNLPLILTGTSRGAMSVVANNLIASGIQLSSPVTSGPGRYVEAILPNVLPAQPINLRSTFVQRPTHVLWHAMDGCAISSPANSEILYNVLNGQLGNAATNAIATGGVFTTLQTGNAVPGPCGAFSFHGFLGIEPAVIAAEMVYLDNFISSLSPNTIPNAAFATVQTAAGVVRQINLATLSSDVNNDTLSYTLAHSTTSLGGSVALNGSILTYTPPAATSNKTDYFVYVVTDGNGGVRAAVVTVQIGS